MLPAEREFCAQLGVSRMTLRAAIRRLCLRGVLDNVQGKGTFIARARVTRDIISTASSDETYKLLSVLRLKPDAAVSSRLLLQSGKEALCVRRIRSHCGERISVESAYLAAGKLRRLNETKLETPGSASIYASQTGREISQSDITVSVGCATFEESEWLGIAEGDPIVAEKHLFFSGAEPVEYLVSVSAARRIVYTASMHFKKGDR